MRIGGFVKSSLIDYPGKVAAVIFTQGCNFRCPYCHNPDLVYPERFGKPMDFAEILDFLRKRRALLDGVVFCGGEPTFQEDLPEAILRIRALGYAVKLDTNGSSPDMLAEILPYLDYVAMDIKAPFGPDYPRVCGIEADDYEIRRSILLIRASGADYEFRTTCHPLLMPAEKVPQIRRVLGRGEKYVVREAKPV
ncbi:MAG TPA: anaerobic ribonucleoside-triphosphate reductase activating protein [Candidatus Omnitrophota bacterium]|nr:anaerobic ribonucleoside-triphosphate reductase activating protein [Candidatus Omnitrophota bacterium]HRZ66614.1 anaerobic ribonucleoside-triphosphate reductase activating protein [Candidatus Omnitrophota bacterium]